MSVLNQMLKDLDQRRALPADLTLPGQQLAAPRRPGFWLPISMLLMLLCAGTAWLFGWSGRQPVIAAALPMTATADAVPLATDNKAGLAAELTQNTQATNAEAANAEGADTEIADAQTTSVQTANQMAIDTPADVSPTLSADLGPNHEPAVLAAPAFSHVESQHNQSGSPAAASGQADRAGVDDGGRLHIEAVSTDAVSTDAATIDTAGTGDTPPAPHAGPVQFRQLQRLAQQQRWAELLNQLTPALRQAYPLQVLALEAHAAAQLGRQQQALQAYQQWAQLAPGDGRAWLGQALLLDASGQHAQAQQLYQRAWQLGGWSAPTAQFIQQRLKQGQ